jgi:Rad3-related DNA helicase
MAGPHGQRWYNLKAIQTVMQMTGRAVRSKDDWSNNIILDKQFDSLLARTRHLLPKWWLDSIRREDGETV